MDPPNSTNKEQNPQQTPLTPQQPHPTFGQLLQQTTTDETKENSSNFSDDDELSQSSSLAKPNLHPSHLLSGSEGIGGNGINGTSKNLTKLEHGGFGDEQILPQTPFGIGYGGVYGGPSSSTSTLDNNGGVGGYATPVNTGLSEDVEARYVVVELFHKQRGGKGVWHLIENGSLIRVTKNVGKRIKLVVKSAIKFERNQIMIRLVDLLHPDLSDKDGRFSIETVVFKENEIGGCNLEYELKIFTLSKKLEFQISIVGSMGNFNGDSVCFATHNSGKQRKRKEPIDKKSKQVLVPYRNDNDLKRKRFSEPPYGGGGEYNVPLPTTDPRPTKKLINNNRVPVSKSPGNVNGIDLILSALSIIENNPCSHFEISSYMNNQNNFALEIYVDEVRMNFPEAIKRTGQTSISIMFCDFLPCVLRDMATRVNQLDENIRLLILSKIKINNCKFSSQRIENEALKYYSLISKENTIPINNHKALLNFSNDPDTIEDMDKRARDFADKIIIPDGIKNGARVAIVLFRRTFDDFHLVIYRDNNLFMNKSIVGTEKCKFININANQNPNDFNGHYSVVLYFPQPQMHFPEGKDTLYLIDYRRDLKVSSLICTPSILQNNLSLWLMGTFIITNEDSKFNYPQNTENKVNQNNGGNQNYPNHNVQNNPHPHQNDKTNPGTFNRFGNFGDDFQQKEVGFQYYI